MSAAKPNPLYIGIGALGINMMLNLLNSKVTNAERNNQLVQEAYQEFLQTNQAEHFLNTVDSIRLSFPQVVLNTLITLMLLMITTGVIIYVISEVRYHKGSFGNLLDGLPILLRVAWYQILTGVMTILWSMLFVIPGIIAHYRYRQGLYLLLDHPEMSALQCVRASKQMMQGNKWELFQLDLSFVGWVLAESALMYALGIAFGPDSYAPGLFLLPMSALIRMYMEFTMFLYYEHLCGIHYDSRISAADPTQG